MFDVRHLLSHGASWRRFDFLGYTFRPRLSKNRFGKHFLNFTPAVSNEAKTRMRREMRSWRVARRSDKTLTDLALMFNRQLQGWSGSTARRRVSLAADGLLAAARRTGHAHSCASGSPQDIRWSIFDAGQAAAVSGRVVAWAVPGAAHGEGLRRPR